MNAGLFVAFILFFVTYAESNVEILSVNVDGLLMNEAQIKASSTCGMKGPEKFCRLVDEGSVHRYFTGVGSILCDICDDRNSSKRHPIENAKSDDDNQWWQSPSMAEGLNYDKVNVTIDLKQIYQIVYIILKMGNSPRPGNWILERSLDGMNYEPWIFFAETPYACFQFKRQFSKLIQMTQEERPSSLDDDEVFCTTYYSQPISLRSGEIIISLINGRKSLTMNNDFTQRSIPRKLINFLSARYIRLRFQKHVTLSADLMTHRGYLEKSIYNRYFYSLRNIEIGGKCICNNHADKCEKIEENGLTVAKCNCRHNTCGRNCEVCCPLFNQKPWKPGATCEECNCNRKSNKCVYNQTVATLQLSMNKLGRMEGGGVCVDCKEKTAGINCEKCIAGYYRPWNVAATELFPCRQCQCDGIGSTGSCISNGEEKGNERPGDCRCKPGYRGRQCDECDLGYERGTGNTCIKCPCSVEGSVNSPSLYRCKPPCSCRVNVEQDSKCEKCKSGYFNLDRNNPDGCQPCFCFGISRICSSLLASTLKVYQLTGWTVTTLTKPQKFVEPNISPLQYPYIDNQIADSKLNSPQVYYFSAPPQFLGSWLTSYNTQLLFVVKIDVDPNSLGSQIDSPDIYLECDKTLLVYRLDSDDPRLQKKVMLTLLPSEWRHDGTNAPVTLEQFMTCLVNITRLLIKAKYYTTQQSIGLLNVTLNRADPRTVIKNEMPFIEKCQCPAGYDGLSCEKCKVGYRRFDNLLVQGVCKKCECNNHSTSCDPYTAICNNCQHNTAGSRCNECKSGYYGNALSGTSDGCKQCACPRLDYQMSNKCSLFKKDKYTCHECKQNTAGPLCNRCMEGFYGDPVNKIECRKCNCNDNQESCNSTTGLCKCKYSTMGANCELCANGFWGDAIKKTCKDCDCNTIGSKGGQYCSNTNGQCQCKNNFTGRQCDRCVRGMFLSNGICIPCQCNKEGVKEENGMIVCDQISGKCQCKSGVDSTGSCDKCQKNYFGFPNCQECRCSNHAKSGQCDLKTGICQCGLNVLDTKCTKCKVNYYWTNKNDCGPCNCGRGSLTDTCDVQSGQCQCAPNVIGRDCNQCKQGYFGISKNGCQKCPECNEGQVCNENGKCVCPPNTQGDKCDTCIANSWGRDPIKGCKVCNCSSEGSMSQSCDTVTGQCNCKSQYTGRTCDSCQPGYFNFPRCQPCLCDSRGTLSDKLKICDPINGQCACKINVQGTRCDECKNGTFGLTADYEGGCFSCFCSGQPRVCNAATNWRLINMEQRQYHIGQQSTGYIAGKDYATIIINRETKSTIGWPLDLYRPMYVDITNLLPGPDITLFYGSEYFSINIKCNGNNKNCGRTLNSFDTEVIMESYNGEIELHYRINWTESKLMQYGIDNSRIKVMMSTNQNTNLEGSWWLVKYSNQVLMEPVQFDNTKMMDLNLWREIMMLSLLNVTRVKVRLYSDQVNPTFANVNLFVNAVANLHNTTAGLPVNTIEKCQCDAISKGLHCQDAIPGYYRRISKPSIEKPSRGGLNISVIVDLRTKIGVEIESCKCYGHSSACDSITGQCYNCTDFTTGPNCNLCITGYYGDPTKSGGICQPCQCPSATNNHAKMCTKKPNGQFLCTCKEGYIGDKCDSCSPGYYGDAVKSECKACGCNPEGSTSLKCTGDEGRCTCAPGVLGIKCDQCSDDFVVENKRCRSCLQGCTKELFDKITELNKTSRELRWKWLPSMKDTLMTRVNKTLMEYKEKLTYLNNLNTLKKAINDKQLERQKDKDNYENGIKILEDLKNQYSKLKTDLIKSMKEADDAMSSKNPQVKKSDLILKKANEELKAIKKISDELNKDTSSQDLQKNFQILKEAWMKYKEAFKDKDFKEIISKLNKIIEQMEIAKKIKEENDKTYRDLDAFYNQKQVEMNLYISKHKPNKDKLTELEKLENQMVDSNNKIKPDVDELVKKKDQLVEDVEKLKKLLGDIKNKKGSGQKFTVPQDLETSVKKHITEVENKIKGLQDNSEFLSKAKEAKDAYSTISNNIKEVEKVIKELLEEVDKIQKEENQLNNDKAPFISIKDKLKQFIDDLTKKYNNLKVEESKIQANINILNDDKPKINDQLKPIQASKENTQKLQESTKIDLDKIQSDVDNFKMPVITNTNQPDIINKQVVDAEKKISDSKEKANKMKDKLKKIKEQIKKMKEDIDKSKMNIELTHGAAANSPEPIKIDQTCMANYAYKTYYLPTSYDFDLEFLLKPKYESLSSLVMFGYDDSQQPPHSFAVIIDQLGQLKFMRDNGANDVKEIVTDGTTIQKDKYFKFQITSMLNNWQIALTGFSPDKFEKKWSQNSISDIDDIIRTSSKTQIFIGGFPPNQILKNLKFAGKLPQKLQKEYGSLPFSGCVYGLKIQKTKVGLADIDNVVQTCPANTNMNTYLLGTGFNCKIDKTNLAALKRNKRETPLSGASLEFHFKGYGYMQIKLASDTCRSNFNTALIFNVQPVLSTNQAHLLAVFFNDKKNYGFAFANLDNKFHVAYWKDDKLVPLTATSKITSESSFEWRIAVKSVDGVAQNDIFGVDELCDSDSFIYLGGVPSYKKDLINKLKSLNIENLYFAGGMSMTDFNDNNQLITNYYITSRFVGKYSKKRIESENTPMYSLLITEKSNEPIKFVPLSFQDILSTGFSMSFSLDGDINGVNNDLISIHTESSKLLFRIESSKFIIRLDNNDLRTPLVVKQRKYYQLRVYIFKTIMTIFLDDQMQGTGMNEIKGSLTDIQLYPLNIPYYVYSMYLGNTPINFNNKAQTLLPKTGVYMKLIPTALDPTFSSSTSIENGGGSDTQIKPKQVRTSANLYQSDQAAIKTYLVSNYQAPDNDDDAILASYSPQSQTYPLNSAWFEGKPPSFGSITEPYIRKHWNTEENNEMSLMVKTTAQHQSELLMQLILTDESSLVFIISSISGHLKVALIENGVTTQWLGILPFSLADQQWHLVKIMGGIKSKQLMIQIDQNRFDLSRVSNVKLMIPKLIQIGGFSGLKLQVEDSNGLKEKVNYFTGCLDEFKINNKIVKLTSTSNRGVQLTQCPRVLEFLINGGQISSIYDRAIEPKDPIKLDMGEVTRINGKIELRVGYKFKYTGFEKGSFLVIGDDNKFCSLVIKSNKMELIYNNFVNKEEKIENLELSSTGWTIGNFDFYHDGQMSICTFKIGTKQKVIVLTSSQHIFNNDFLTPTFYFGLHPNLLRHLTNTGTKMNHINFSGCISDLKCFQGTQLLKKCEIEKSPYVIGGQCSLDKKTYLLKIK